MLDVGGRQGEEEEGGGGGRRGRRGGHIYNYFMGKEMDKMALVSSWISLGKVIDDAEVKGFQTA